MSVLLEPITVMSMLVVLILLVASTAHVFLDTEATAPVVRVSDVIIPSINADSAAMLS